MRSRIHLPQTALEKGVQLALPDAPAHKLARVLRAKTSEHVKLFNAGAGEWLAEIVDLRKSKVVVSVIEQTRQPYLPPDIWLAFAPVKKDALNVLVEKATELGVRRLLPVITDRTEYRRLKLERLAATISDAAEQTERLDVPTLEEPQGLSEFLQSLPADRPLLAGVERGDAQPLTRVAPSLPADPAPILLTGPEGGWSGAELERLKAHPQTRAISLGPRILRAETAALSALAVLQALWGDWDGARPEDSFAPSD